MFIGIAGICARDGASAVFQALDSKFRSQGQPHCVRIAEIGTRRVPPLLVQRTRLPEAMKPAEIKNSGVYFLFGQPKESIEKKFQFHIRCRMMRYIWMASAYPSTRCNFAN